MTENLGKSLTFSGSDRLRHRHIRSMEISDFQPSEKWCCDTSNDSKNYILGSFLVLISNSSTVIWSNSDVSIFQGIGKIYGKRVEDRCWWQFPVISFNLLFTDRGPSQLMNRRNHTRTQTRQNDFTSRTTSSFLEISKIWSLYCFNLDHFHFRWLNVTLSS